MQITSHLYIHTAAYNVWLILCKYTGEFGIVYKSHLLQTKDGDEITFVAVKTLKGNISL